MTAEPEPAKEEKKKQLSKQDYKDLYEAEKSKNELFILDESAEEGVKEHTIQWRETDGIYKAIAFRAKSRRMSVNKYCQKIIKESFGYY